MNRVALVLAFVRALVGAAAVSDVTVDRGGGDNRTPEHFSDPGDDSFPLDGDFVALVDQSGTGRDSAVGYVDPKNLQKSTKGDKRIYARDPETGAQVVELWLKSDGSGTLSNALGSGALLPNGDFLINGVTIKANGDVIIPNSLVLDTKELADHDHSQANDSGGNTEEDTGPNN